MASALTVAVHAAGDVFAAVSVSVGAAVDVAVAAAEVAQSFATAAARTSLGRRKEISHLIPYSDRGLFSLLLEFRSSNQRHLLLKTFVSRSLALHSIR